MRPRPLVVGSLALILAVTATACGGSDDDIFFEPTPVVLITETFMGTLTVNGANTHPFQSDGGGLTATLIALSPNPDETLAVGLALGTWNGAACQVVIANDSATQGATVAGGASRTGNLCVRIYDVGNLTEAATYEILVEHP